MDGHLIVSRGRLWGLSRMWRLKGEITWQELLIRTTGWVESASRPRCDVVVTASRSDGRPLGPCAGGIAIMFRQRAARSYYKTTASLEW